MSQQLHDSLSVICVGLLLCVRGVALGPAILAAAEPANQPTEAERQFWAFQKLARGMPPAIRQTDQVRTPPRKEPSS